MGVNMSEQEVIEILSGINLSLKSLQLCKEDLPKIGNIVSMIDSIIDDLKRNLQEEDGSSSEGYNEYYSYLSRGNAHLIGHHPKPPLPGFESPYSIGGKYYGER